MNLWLKTTVLCGPFFLTATPALAARARVCGAELYNTSAGPQCGAPTFRQAVGASQCGTDRVTRWSGWGKDCDKGIFTDLGDALLISTTLGVFTGDSETRIHKWSVQTRHKCSVDIPRACRHPDFGVEAYPTCQHESFGVSLYRDCALMTEEEVLAYTNTMRSWIPTIAIGYTSAISTYNAIEKSETKLACLISDYEQTQLPFVVDIVEKLKTNFESTYGKPYSKEYANCADSSSLVNEILEKQPTGIQAHDDAVASLKQHHSLLSVEKNRTMDLLRDVVAVTSPAYRQELEGVVALINEITAGE